MATRCLWCVLPWLLATALMPVQAGQACNAKPPSLKTIERGMALADKVSQALDGSGDCFRGVCISMPVTGEGGEQGIDQGVFQHMLPFQFVQHCIVFARALPEQAEDEGCIAAVLGGKLMQR